MKKGQLRSFRLRYFKAVQDSGAIKFGPLTVFIGNNGSGKSSIVEGLETFRDIVLDGLDAALVRWRGLEYVWNNAVTRELTDRDGTRPHYTKPLSFELNAFVDGNRVEVEQRITLGSGGNQLYIEGESSTVRGAKLDQRRERDIQGRASVITGRGAVRDLDVLDGDSVLKAVLGPAMIDWQFLALVPDAMGQPAPQQRATGRIRLARNGSNIAEYLDEIHRLDLSAFNGIVESLQYVLPYAADLQPTMTSELGRSFYLKLKEGSFFVPGWLISTGTLRILALLACLRHPNPPPVLVVEEVENGLDPRTLHMLVEEIRAAITLGKTQVILTTHSPYLLDLLALEHIVVVERIDGEPVFKRPDKVELAKWAESFSPGRLYTMGRLTRND